MVEVVVDRKLERLEFNKLVSCRVFSMIVPWLAEGEHSFVCTGSVQVLPLSKYPHAFDRAPSPARGQMQQLLTEEVQEEVKYGESTAV